MSSNKKSDSKTNATAEQSKGDQANTNAATAAVVGTNAAANTAATTTASASTAAKVEPVSSGSTNPMIGTVAELLANKVKLNGQPLDKTGISALRLYHFGKAIKIDSFAKRPGQRGRATDVFELMNAPGFDFTV